MPGETVTDDYWNADVLGCDGAVVVAFLARASTPCRAFTPELERLQQAVPAAVRVVRLDVDDSPITARRYDVSSLPTLLVFRGGVLKGRVVGACGGSRLRRRLAALLES